MPRVWETSASEISSIGLLSGSERMGVRQVGHVRCWVRNGMADRSSCGWVIEDEEGLGSHLWLPKSLYYRGKST